jgi:cysteine desulfurase / selenocysteine lyase
MMNVTQDFPILTNNLVYLDSAATTQKPQVVLDRIMKYYSEENANVHRGIYTLSQIATMEYEQSREIIAKFIGAKSKEIIFTKGTTEGLNLLATSLSKTLEEGDEIVLSVMEHHANLVPWQQIAKEKKIILKFIQLTKEYGLDMENAKALITDKTKIVSIVHMSNVLGTINDVKVLADLVHKRGGLLIVDGAQSIAHMPINIHELDCDFFVFSGHKIYGPTGIGVLYGREKLLDGMIPYQFGGDMISEVTLNNATWNELPWKFEAGTPNIVGAVGLATAVEYVQGIGMDKIQEHEGELIEYFMGKVEGCDITIIGPTINKGAVFSFVMKGVHPHDVSEVLNTVNVAVRGGHHCAMPLMHELGLSGTTRASFGIYTTREDIDSFLIGIRKVKEVFQ